MSENTANNPSPSSKALVLVAWAYVGLPLAWGIYQTLTNVAALFTGG